MGLFGKKNSNIPTDSINTEDEILGYLDELISRRIPLEVSISNIVLKCNIYSLVEKKGLIQIEQKDRFDNFSGKATLCGFSLDKAWFIFKSKLIISNNKFFVEIPNFISFKERRQAPRTSFVSREAVSISVLESLGSGIGVTGNAINISEGGFCAGIIRVMNLDSKKEIRAHKELFKQNQPVMLVRIKNIPGVREFDTEGKVNRVFLDREWKIAVSFKGIPGAVKKELKQFIESRIPAFKLFKRSRKKRLEIEKRQKEAAETQNNNKENNVVLQQKEKIPKVILQKKENFTLLSMGNSIIKEIDFLRNVSFCTWIHCENPLELSKHLRQSGPSYLVLPYSINGKNMLDYLKKLYSMNLLSKLVIVILNTQKIQIEDISKCKLLGIKHIIELPLADPLRLKKIFNLDLN